MVARCDALEAEAGTEVLCKYNRTVGTRWTDETRGHMNVSSEVHAAIQVVNGYSMELQIVTRSFGINRVASYYAAGEIRSWFGGKRARKSTYASNCLQYEWLANLWVGTDL